MKAETLTAEVAETIIEQMQRYYTSRKTAVCGHVMYNGDEWRATTDICYGPLASALHLSATHPDHFGVVFQGWTETQFKQGIQAPEVTLWLDALLSPEGSFKDVLPHLYHATSKEIIEDRGFVIQNALECNAGLLWTFLQATRLMYENPHRMAPFVFAMKELPDEPVLALFTALALKMITRDYCNWTVGNPAHGEPLGAFGYALAHNFLNGKVLKHDVFSTNGSYQCFGERPNNDMYYRDYPRYPRPFHEWCKLFREMKLNPNVKVGPYVAAKKAA